MKKLILALIGLTIIYCSSCKKSTTTEPSPFGPDTDLITLSFSPYNMEPIRDDISAVVNRLDVWIIDGEDVYDYHQEKNTATSFGTFHITLNRTKTYTLYAVGHKADGPATLEDGLISFPNNKVTHSMFYTTTFSPATTTALECAMQRIVGMFKFTITDELHEDLDHIKFSLSETGLAFDVTTQTAANKAVREWIPSTMNPNANGDYVFNLFIIADNMTEIMNVDITVQAFDENDGIIEQREFTDVPIKNGWVTHYTGTFFVTSELTINFTIGDWSNFDDHPY